MLAVPPTRLPASSLPTAPTWSLATHRARPVEALRRARDGDRTARAGVALGLAGLPLLRPTVGGNLGPADLGLLLGIGGVLLGVTATRQLVRSAYLVPVALLALAGMLSGLAGGQPAVALLAVAQDLYLALWALACLNLARSTASAAFLTRCWCLSACGWGAALLVVEGRTVLGASGDTRLAFTSDTNGAGLYFVLSIFVILAAGRPARPWLRRGVVALLLVDAVLTGSLGALTGLLAGLAVAVVLGVLSRRGPAPAVALLMALVLTTSAIALYAESSHVVAAAHTSSNVLLRNSLGRGAQSSGERAQLDKEVLRLVQGSGLVGAGPNSTEQRLRAEQAPYPKQAHNDWLAALVERGWLGLLAVVLLAVELVGRSARLRVGALARGWGASLPAPHFLVGGLVTVAVFSVTHEVLHDRTAWTLLGVVAAFSSARQDRPGDELPGRDDPPPTSSGRHALAATGRQ